MGPGRTPNSGNLYSIYFLNQGTQTLSQEGSSLVRVGGTPEPQDQWLKDGLVEWLLTASLSMGANPGNKMYKEIQDSGV